MRCHNELPEEYFVQRNLRSVIGSKGTLRVPWKHCRAENRQSNHLNHEEVTCSLYPVRLESTRTVASQLYQTSDIKR